jgi:hypothetical protein
MEKFLLLSVERAEIKTGREIGRALLQNQMVYKGPKNMLYMNLWFWNTFLSANIFITPIGHQNEQNDPELGILY